MDENGRATKRLFIGISFDEALKVQIEGTIQKLKVSADKKHFDVKWTPPQNLHLTLKFLGEVDTDGIDAINSKLADVSRAHGPINLKVRGLGGFPQEKQARILWVGIQNKVELRNLHNAIEEEFAKLGFEMSEQEFIPHVTLGRLRNKKNVEDLISPFVRKDFGKARVLCLNLFESHLQGNFPIYKSVSEFKLMPQPGDEE